MSVARITRVGGKWLDRLAERIAVGVEGLAQRSRKAFGVRTARLPGDDQRNDPRLAPHALEEADLFIHIIALRRLARAQHDHEFGIGKSLPDHLAEGATTGKLLAVAEDRPQRFGHRAQRRIAADQAGIDTPGFQFAMDAAREPVIAVAV